MRPRLSVKRVVFAGLALMTLLTIYEHETPLLKASDPEWAHIAPFRWWLLPHVITAAVALVVGPFQFSGSVRRRSLALHRWLGRVYVIAVLAASSLALYIGVAFEDPANRWLMGTMAGLWLVATAFAWLAARNRDINQHRLWITRSYCLTFTFVLTRLIPDMILPGMGYVGVTALYWVLIVGSLLAPDLMVNGRSIVRRARHVSGR
jgi:uncharacterized membrane protein